MSTLTLYAHKADRVKVMELLQTAGVIQPTELPPTGLTKPRDIPHLKEISDLLVRTGHLHSILNLPPKKLTFVQKLFGLELLEPVPIKRENTQSFLSRVQTVLDKHETALITEEETIIKATEQLDELKQAEFIITNLINLGVPIELFADTERLYITLGELPTAHIEPIKTALETATKSESVFVHKEKDAKTSLGVIIAHRNHEQQAQLVAKKHAFSPYALPKLPEGEHLSTYVANTRKQAETNKTNALATIASIRETIFQYIVVFHEELTILKHRYELIHKARDSTQFFTLQAWIQSRHVKGLQQTLEQELEGRVALDIEEVNSGDNVPVALNNPRWLKPFEMITELYSPPKYRDLDPTFIVGPIFIVYAAFMLTDAVYGFLLAILGTFLLLKFGKYSKGLKHLTVSVISMGILCTIFGVLTGSYFGDFPKYLIGKETAELAIWKDPLADPLYFLIVSLSVAAIHLNIGLFLGLLEDIRKKDYKSLLSERVIWFVLELSLVLFYFQHPLAKWILGATVLAVVLLHGPLGLLSITGLLGDAISYSRLFALALSTAGIALAVNLLADLVRGIPGVGIILTILIFVGGHLFGFVMNTIGAFVHSLRLQFVEFFGRFYEGGGDSFTALKEERIYTKVK